jgi:very-short-patch-repair endonuclease
VDVCDFSDIHGAGEGAAVWVAGQQLDLVTTKQLAVAGVTERMITIRHRRGTLHRVHQGVHLLGTGAMLPGARELAAVLACGDHSLIRRRSALALLGITPPWGGDIEVITVGRRPRDRSGLDLHCVAALSNQDRGTQHGIPIVAPAFALLEFAAIATGDELERAIAEAYVLKLATERQLRRTLERNVRVAGAAALRAELDREGGPQWTRKEAERRMKLLLRGAGLPIALTDQRVAGFKADFFWPAQRLIVEVDGYQFHSSRWAFERDHRRDQAHKNAGYEVIRVTWRQLNEEPLRVVAAIAMALGRAGA